MAIVLESSRERRYNDSCIFELAETVGRGQRRHLNQQIINVGRAFPVFEDRRYSKWGVQAVNVPIVWTHAARNDCSTFCSRLFAVVAENSLAFLTLSVEINLTSSVVAILLSRVAQARSANVSRVKMNAAMVRQEKISSSKMGKGLVG